MRMAQITRFQKLQSLLSRPTGATIPELMEGTESSRPTVYRLLEAIENSGQALEKEELDARRVRYKLYAPFGKAREGSVRLRIAIDEWVAVQFVRSYARLFKGTELEQDIDNVFQKLGASIDPKHYAILKRTEKLFLPSLKGAKNYSSEKVAQDIDTLAKAVLLEQKCAVRYESYSEDRIVSADIAPLHFFQQGGGLYLFAQMDSQPEVRMFAVERFKSVSMKEEKYEYPAGFDPIRRLEGTFTVFDRAETTTFRIRFTANEARYIAERRWAEKQRIDKEPDGSIVLTMETAGHWDVLSWVLSYGDEAELLEPKALRRELSEMAESISRKYRDPAGNEIGKEAT